jgi:nitrate reductase beta subunit
MIVYDCDETKQSAALESRMADRDLVGEKLLQAFGPDILAEARNRGFDSR